MNNKINIRYVVVRIDDLLRLQRRTREELAAYIGKNKQVFTDWKNKDVCPKVEDLWQISNFLGVRMEYLLFGEVREKTDEVALLAMFNSIPPKYQKLVLETLKAQMSYIRDNYDK